MSYIYIYIYLNIQYDIVKCTLVLSRCSNLWHRSLFVYTFTINTAASFSISTHATAAVIPVHQEALLPLQSVLRPVKKRVMNV